MLLPFRRYLTRRQVEHLIREGVGVQESAWPFDGPDGDHHELSAAIETWVREAMGRMRRPYGIDQVTLALACRNRAGRVVCSNAMGVVPAATFYSPAGTGAIEDCLADAGAVPPEDRWEVVGALVSLGDLVFALGKDRAA